MRLLSLVAALIGAACSGPRLAEFPERLPPPALVTVVEAKDPNLEVIVIEAVPNVEDEGVSFTKVFVDGKESGKTAVGTRSQEKRVRLKLPAGNQPVRLEHWLLPPIGEWTPVPEEMQARERFVRIEEGVISRLTLRYGPVGPPTLAIVREAAPKP
jgi:hypothetical protein